MATSSIFTRVRYAPDAPAVATINASGNITMNVPTMNPAGDPKNQVTASLSNVSEGLRLTSSTGIVSGTVVNKAGFILPSTGGPGATLFTLFGLALISAAAAGVVMKRRRT